MQKICRYALYELRIFLRVKAAVFYTIVFPTVLLILYAAANYSEGKFLNINNYFPYLTSITLISATAGLTSTIVSNRIHNTWKFYSLYGYKTTHMAAAVGLVHYFISVVMCMLMALLMVFGFQTMEFSMAQFAIYFLAVSVSSVIYIQIAIIVALSINDLRNAQTVINTLTYSFIILSGSIIRFDPQSAIGKVMALFPNIHIGNLLYSAWNNQVFEPTSIKLLTGFFCVCCLIIAALAKQSKGRFYYKNEC